MEKKEAMKILKDFHDKSALFSVRTALHTIIPELKESEDEEKPNGGIVLEDFNEGDGFYKVNLAYLSKKQAEEIENIVKKWNHELKESEDERIRNQIINFIEEYGNPIHCEWQKDWIAWLENQNKHAENNEDDVDTDFTIYHPLKNGKGHYECIPYSFYGILSSFSEDKDIIDFLRLCFYTEEECNEWIKQNESTDKVEPKFHEGDWVVKGDTIAQILDIQEQYYVGLDINGKDFTSSRFLNDDKIHLWTIQDAKDGDALYSPCNKLLWIFKTKDTVHCGCNLNYNNGAFIGEGYIMMPTDAIPATKSQRDTLFAKMKEAGYEWDEETHELKKISQRMVSAEAKEALYDKPTDEEMKELLRTEYEKGRADTIAEMKSSWSEEDERLLESTTAFIEANNTFCSWKGKSKKDILPWLKSLKERYTWKPSSEQMDALNDVISSRDIKYDVLSELWKDLAKL